MIGPCFFGPLPQVVLRGGTRGLRVEEKPMAKMRKKSDLPTKICVVCGLAFVWRKKWARDWDRVTHCSDRCRTVSRACRPRPQNGNDP